MKDKDGTPLIVLDQDVVSEKDGKTTINMGNFPFPTDRFGKVIYPKKGEVIKMSATYEYKDGKWEEVIDEEF